MALQTYAPSQAAITSVGTATSGGTANSPKPVITGTADAGNIVVIYDGIKQIGSVVAAADGTWSFTPLTDIKSGSHNFAAIPHDGANNFGAASAQFPVTIPAAAGPATPATPTLTDDAGASIPSGSTTADAHPHINGVITPNDIVKVYDGSTLIGSVKADSEGKWSFTPTTDLTPGAHSITVTDTNPANVESPHSGAAGFTVDTSVPAAPTITSASDYVGDTAVVPGIPASGSVVPSPDVVIRGKGAVPNAVVYVYDGNTLVGSVVATISGSWMYENATYTQGLHDMSVTQKNAAGTESAHSNHWSFTVDSSTPAKPAAPTMTDDSGASIPAGSVTPDAHPHINGDGGKPGDTITVLDGGTPIGSTTVKPDGTWSFTPVPDLKPGPHDITVIDTNAAGTPSPASDPTHITVDPVPAKPAAPTMTDDSGASIPAGSVTPDVHPHINGGGATPGDTITVLDGGTPIGTATVKPDGTWSYTPVPDLKPGPHDITVIDSTPAGTSSPASDPTHITVDPVPAKPATPTLSDDSGATIPAGSTTTDGHPHISGTGTAGDTATVYDGATVIGSVKIDANGKWTFTPGSDVSKGAHSISVTDTTPAGTTGPKSDSIAFTFTPVAGAPVITDVADATNAHTGTIPVGGLTADSHPTITGTGVAGNTIYIFQNGVGCGQATVNANGTWSLKLTGALSEGAHAMTATQFANGDSANQSAASNSWTIRVDSSIPATPAAPTLTDDSGVTIPAGSTTADAHPHINGNGTAGDIIKVYDNGGTTPIGSTTVKPDGTWSFTPSPDLSNGTNAITVTETNAAGTPSAMSPPTSITVDTSIPATPAAPTLTDDSGVTIPAGSTTADAHPHINGNGTAGDIIKVYDNGGTTPIGSTTVKPDGTWSFTPSPDLSNGTNAITVTESNAAGTPSAMSPPTSITVDTSIPAKPPVPVLTDDNSASIPAGSTTTDGHPHISGTGTAGDIVTVYDGANVIGSAKIQPNGTWTFTPSSDVANGPHSISVTDTNAAGTTGPHSDAIAFTFTPAMVAPTETPTINFVLDHLAGNYYFSGTSINDPAPQLTGVISSALLAGEQVAIWRDGVLKGYATVSGNRWTFDDSGLSVGMHSYQARVQSSAGVGPTSNTFIVNELGPVVVVVPPTETTTISYLLDHLTGGHVPTGGSTTDAAPQVVGSISSPLLAGEQVAIWRDGALVGHATVSGTTWTYNDSGLSTGSHTYQARVENSGGVGPMSNTVVITELSAVAPAPVITGAADASSDHTGAVPAGGTTADTQPTFSGTGVAGNTVYLYDNGRGVGDAVVDATGNWTIHANKSLDAGVNNMTATQFNSQQSQSAASNVWAITVDTSPKVPTETVNITNLVDDSSGSNVNVANGGSTKDTSPIVQGNVSNALLSGETLVVYRDGAKVGNATMSGTSWSFNDSGVGVGNHTYTARVENANGTGAYSAGYSFTEAASTLPVPTETVAIINMSVNDGSGASLISNGDSTRDASPTVQGSVSASLQAGESLVVYRDGQRIGTATVSTSGNGRWIFNDSGVGAGSHTYTAQVENTAGHGPTSNTFTVNELAPVVIPSEIVTITGLADHVTGGTVPNGGSSTDSHPTIQGRISSSLLAGETIQVYRDGGYIGTAAVSGTTWSITEGSAVYVGSHTYTAVVQGSTGRGATSSPFTFTEVAAALPVPTETTTISYLLDHLTGGHVPTGGSTTDTAPQVVGSISSPLLAGEQVAIWRDGALTGYATVSGTTWTFNESGLSTGSHTYQARVESSGGVGPMSNTVVITELSAVAPAPVITGATDASSEHTGAVPAGGTTADTQPTFSGTGVAGNTVYLYDNGRGIGDAVVDATGHWTIHVGSGLDAGVNNMTATQFNSQQSQSAASNVWAITVDTSPKAPTETVNITNLVDDSSGSNVNVANGGSTTDTSPIVQGNVSHALLSGETLVVYRDGAKVGNATMSGTSWSFNDSGVAVGSHTYTARVENNAGNGSYSGGYSFTEAASGHLSALRLYYGVDYLNNYFLTMTPGLMPSDSNRQALVFRMTIGNDSFWAYDTGTGMHLENATLGTSIFAKYSASTLVTVSAYGTSGGLLNKSDVYTYSATFGDLYSKSVWDYGTTGDPRYYAAQVGITATGAAAPISGSLYAATHHDSSADALAMAAAGATDQPAATADQPLALADQPHSVVADHQAFTGTTGHDTVDLNVDPTV